MLFDDFSARWYIGCRYAKTRCMIFRMMNLGYIPRTSYWIRSWMMTSFPSATNSWTCFHDFKKGGSWRPMSVKACRTPAICTSSQISETQRMLKSPGNKITSTWSPLRKPSKRATFEGGNGGLNCRNSLSLNWANTQSTLAFTIRVLSSSFIYLRGIAGSSARSPSTTWV